MKMWMQFGVMPWTSLGVDAVLSHAQEAVDKGMWTETYVYGF